MKFRLVILFCLLSLLLIGLWQQLFQLPFVIVPYHMAVMVPLHLISLSLIAWAHTHVTRRWHVVAKVGTWFLITSFLYLLLFGSMHYWGDIITLRILGTYLSDFSGFLHSLPFSYSELWLGIGLFILAHYILVFIFARPVSAALIDLWQAITAHRRAVWLLLFVCLLAGPLLMKAKRVVHKAGEPLMVMLFDHMWGVTDNPLFSPERIRAGFEDSKLRKQYALLPQPMPRRNVIIIIVDALRADHLSAYGYQRHTSPFLDELIQNGKALKVKHCESTCSCTLCGVPSILLSRTWNDCAINGFNIIGLLKDRGYHTYAFIAGAHKEWYNMAKFYSADCDLYFDGKQSKHYYFKDDRVLLEGMAQVGPASDTPGLFYFHLQATHETGLLLDTYAIYKPYKKSLSSKNLNSEAAINEYDNKVVQADDIIRQLFAALDRKGYLKNSTVLITADHGQGLGEHGISGHVDWLYEPQVSVPLIIYDDSLSFYHNTDLARQIDIAPTIADRLGLSIPGSWMGRSLRRTDIAEYSYHETGKTGLETRQSKYMLLLYGPEVKDRVSRETYKYIFTADLKQEELYDLNTDPLEKNNLCRTGTDLLEQMRTQAQKEMRSKFSMAAAER